MKDDTPYGPLDWSMHKAENERNIRLTQHICFTILRILQEYKAPMSIDAIIQQAKLPSSCPIAAFLDGLVVSGYLSRNKVSGGYVYSMSEKNKGPFLALPYYVLELYPPDYDTGT